MTNKEKLERLKTFLDENKLRYYPEYKGKRNVKPELYIPKYRIMVKISEGEEKDRCFFQKVKFKYHPLFIRDNETVEFVMEKMRNLVIDIMTIEHKAYQKKYNKKNTK